MSEPKPKGRPTKYTDALGAQICERLASGATLRAICRDDGIPSESTVRSWAIDTDHPFSAQYARARETGYSLMADELVEIADGTDSDAVGDDPSVVQRDRLRVETRKWLLSKALPKVYGERTAVDLNVKRDVVDITDAELQHIATAGRQGTTKKANGSAQSN